MDCRHGRDLEVCATICARCGHGCPDHRAEANGRGVGGDTCWTCAACPVWVEPTGDAGVDAGLELLVILIPGASRAEIEIYSWGKQVGEMVLAGAGRNEATVERVKLRARVRGKGLGQSLYLELGKRLGDVTLISGARQTEDARRMWQALVAKGKAVEVEGGFRLEAPDKRKDPR